MRAMAVMACLAALPVAAESGPALRTELFVSSDTDGNRVQRSALGWDVTRTDIEHWWGFKAERARFSGDGWRDSRDSLSVRAAGGAGLWRWQGELGSDGQDVLGSASVHSTEGYRKEWFLERNVLETRQGLALERVHTFAGAAMDVPLSERWSATVLAGLQDFGADNLRRHLRGNLVFAVLPGQGVSVQLRYRQFNDSDPRELDYFAPGRYRQALAVVSIRRFVGGYQWRASAGLGRQDFTGVDRHAARLLELDFQTPKDNGHYLRATAGYSDAPADGADLATGNRYGYRYVRVEGVWQF